MRKIRGYINIVTGLFMIFFCTSIQMVSGQEKACTTETEFSTEFRFEDYNDKEGNRKPNPEPEQIYGPIYSVGPLTVCVYLLVTSEAMILFDSGYYRDGTLVPDNIRKLGFDPADIRKVFISHWHGDHSSGSARIADLYGAEVMVHKLDAEIVRTGIYRGDSISPPVKNVIELEDGQVFNFGDAVVKVIHTPGQTAGEVVYLVDMHGPQGKCRALVAGDATGFKSDVESFERNCYHGVCEDYEKTVKILKSLEFDLYLGGHPHQVWEEMREDGFPFVTREQWQKMVDNRHQQKIEFLKEHPEYADF